MKNIILILFITSLFVRCNYEPIERVEVIIDTLYLPCNNDSLISENKQLKNSKDSVIAVSDTLAKRLLHSRLVISNVKYYLNICIKNPSQDKFLKGWIRRAVE